MSLVARAKAAGRRAAGSGRTPEGEPLLILKTAGAAGIAWAVAGQLTGSSLPVLASLAAVLVVQATVYQTIQSGLRRVVGVVLGVLLALALGRLLGLTAWNLTLLLLLALVVGRMFRLGGQTSQVAISALLVLAIGGTAAGYGRERIAETLVGALVGVLVNVLIVPPVHVHATRNALVDMARDLAELFVDAGSQLSGGELAFAPARTKELLSAARELNRKIADIWDQLDHASESLRYNPRRSVFVSPARKPAPAALLAREKAAADAIDHMSDQATGITRVMFDIGEGRVGAEWDPDTAAQVGALASSAGHAVEMWAQALDIDDPGAPRSPGAVSPRELLVASIENVRGQLAALSRELAERRGIRHKEMTANWVPLGSVLADISRVLSEIDPEAGLHKQALSATPAARLHLRWPTWRPLRQKLQAVRGRLRGWRRG